ncbi:MAG: flippase [Candidatus Omnitrophota bacterium]|jgi:O-antigen/teichoic acid export membrane protein
MNEAKLIFKNSLWLVIGEIISKIAIFFLMVILARKVEVSDFGKYNLAVSVATIFSFIGDLGLNIFLFRETARNRGLLSKYVSNILAMRLILSIIFLAIVYFFTKIFHYSSDVARLIYLFSGWLCFMNLTFVFRTSFKAMEIMKWDAIANILDNILRLAITVVLLSIGLNVLGVGIAYFLSGVMAFLFCLFIFIRYFTKFNFKLDFSLWFVALKEMPSLSLVAILIPMFGMFDLIILAHFKGEEAVGLYGASLKLVLMLILIPGLITQAAFPKLSQQAFKNEDKFRSSVSYLVKTIFIFSTLASLVIFLLSNYIIHLVYGAKYLTSARVLQILIWCFPLHALNGVFIYGLNARNKQNVNTIFIGSSILLNILLAIVLAPKFSYIGVSFATLSSLIVLSILFNFYYSKKNYVSLKELKLTYKDLFMIKNIFSSEVAP